ncbi:MAG: hypothetical protein PUC72_07960 [Bacteroidales bacterium]|nr:hypothetical protein [Bacteroidales bacterium]
MNVKFTFNNKSEAFKATIKDSTLTVHQVPFGWGGMPRQHFRNPINAA